MLLNFTLKNTFLFITLNYSQIFIVINSDNLCNGSKSYRIFKNVSQVAFLAYEIIAAFGFKD